MNINERQSLFSHFPESQPYLKRYSSFGKHAVSYSLLESGIFMMIIGPSYLCFCQQAVRTFLDNFSGTSKFVYSSLVWIWEVNGCNGTQANSSFRFASWAATRSSRRIYHFQLTSKYRWFRILFINNIDSRTKFIQNNHGSNHAF